MCLFKLKDAEVGKQYPGMVASVKHKGSLIVFYGGVRGWLPKYYAGFSYNKDMFFIGQIVSFEEL